MSDKTTWEYHSLRVPREPTKKEARDPTDRLDALGEEGWELTTTAEYVGGGTKFMVLKRPSDASAVNDYG